MLVHRASMFAVAGVAALGLGVSSARADLSTWSLREPIQLQVFNSTTNDYDVVANVPTSSTPFTNGLTVVGSGTSADSNNSLYSITGAQYTALNPGTDTTSNDRGLRFIAIEDAVLNQPYDNTVDRLTTSFDVKFDLNGTGTVNLFDTETGYGLADASENDLENVGSSGLTDTFTAGDHEDTVQYVDSFGIPNASDGTHIIGDFVLGFEWSGYSPTDVLEISLPNTGVTVVENTVPEPASFALLAPAMLLMKRRRAGSKSSNAR